MSVIVKEAAKLALAIVGVYAFFCATIGPDADFNGCCLSALMGYCIAGFSERPVQ